MAGDFKAIISTANFQTIECHNPFHAHKTPFQEMAAVEYRDHHVAVTRDDTDFSVRFDDNPSTDTYGLSRDEVATFVERFCDGGD